MSTATETPVHRYVPYGTCVELFKARDREVLFAGPAGTGKSRACLEKVHALAMLNKGCRILLVRKTLNSLSSTGLVTFREEVAAEHIASGEVKWYGGSPQEAACYKYKNGSVVVVGGMDNPTKIMSSQYDVVYVQESTELREDDWEKITTRLRNGKISFQQIIADANPDVPGHWLKVRCDKGLTRMIASRHQDNPRYYKQLPLLDDTGKMIGYQAGEITPDGKEYIGGLDRLQGVRYQRLRHGKWAAAEGIVYDGYDPVFNGHKAIKQIPKDWRLYLSVDFGYTHPFVCQFWAEDKDGRLYLVREIYKTETAVEDHCKDIKAVIKSLGKPRIHAIICDHDAGERAVLTKHLGHQTIPAKKSKTDGIQAVMMRLRDAGDGKPRLYLCEDATYDRDQLQVNAAKPTSSREEILGYIWDRRDNRPAKEEPVKDNDDGMDAMRYMVAFKDLKGRSTIRFIQ